MVIFAVADITSLGEQYKTRRGVPGGTAAAAIAPIFGKSAEHCSVCNSTLAARRARNLESLKYYLVASGSYRATARRKAPGRFGLRRPSAGFKVGALRELRPTAGVSED